MKIGNVSAYNTEGRNGNEKNDTPQRYPRNP